MFARFFQAANRAAPLVSRNLSNSIIAQDMNRLFSSSASHIPKPHSKEYLQLQQKLFKLDDIPTDLTVLHKGTELVGLNITAAEPRFLNTGPVYNPQILKTISDSEKNEWLEMAKSYYAQLGKYELLCDVNCVTTKSEAGVPIHYIDHSLLHVKSYTPLEKVFDVKINTPTL
ncbi:hypothetical protein [Legionella cincinnatiensis]|uniref:Uncharacterized protein n=1 Tax=Legionella cincinnatiensis TaxID=28085 RepID=A0A378IFG6_9GAMM|nr:hypothetical protein [Legionella cincinnatiensis]KTC92194.1 hypothetical protein Lcin_0973 [Legionella cincinnatiensis]STX33502.1 Uncharacterised protein [Legionella cincinnatiensis]